MTTKLFGSKVARVEDQRFLRGQGRYVDDLLHDDPRLLHAAVLRSPHAHAKITDIDVSDVLDVEGVVAVWTYDDLTGPSRCRCSSRTPPSPTAARSTPWPRTRSTTSARPSRSWSPPTATWPRTPSR